MKVARLTAASAHHRLESLLGALLIAAPVLADPVLADSVLADSVLDDTGLVLSPSFMYAVPVSCSCTPYRYVVKHGLYDVQLSSD